MSFCSSLDALSGGILFCRIQMFQFLAENHGLKSGVFIDILSALIVPHWKVLRSRNLCHSAPLDIPFPTVFFFVEVKIFNFWPKTMDYSQAFWPKSRSFFEVLLLHTGRCYGVEICAILLLLTFPFRRYPFLLTSKFSISGQKPWTIVRRFGQNRGHSLWSFYSTLEGAMELKVCHSAPL